jgi:hypothetical protein
MTAGGGGPNLFGHCIFLCLVLRHIVRDVNNKAARTTLRKGEWA